MLHHTFTSCHGPKALTFATPCPYHMSWAKEFDVCHATPLLPLPHIMGLKVLPLSYHTFTTYHGPKALTFATPCPYHMSWAKEFDVCHATPLLSLPHVVGLRLYPLPQFLEMWCTSWLWRAGALHLENVFLIGQLPCPKLLNQCCLAFMYSDTLCIF